jgi:ornithine cyclodeaminase/alanine dehydrogenase-like protein (mu-crystallin family)
LKRVTFRYLSQEDILGLRIPYVNVIDTIEKVMVSHAKGMTECPPKPGVFTREKSFLHAMPAYIKDMDICGIKWVGGYPGNREKLIPAITGLLIYNDAETGLPLAAMDCRWITAARTAAVAAVTAKYCKPSKSETITIIGAGEQARWSLVFISITVPELKKCFINDINEASTNRFIKEMQPRVPNIELVPISASELKNSIDKSQICLTATQNLSEPIITREMPHAGLLGIALESNAWEHSIYTEVIDRFVCDDWGLVLSYQKKGAFQLGLPKDYFLLGNIIAGDEVGRKDDNEYVMSFNMGISVSDIAVAKIIYEEALVKNLGIELQLMEQEDILY